MVVPRAAATEFFARPDGIYSNASTEKLQLRGVNWFGCETEQFCPHALWEVPLESLLDMLENHKFNAVRFTFSTEFALGLDSLECKVNPAHNPGMVGWKAGRMLDHVVAECGKHGILVALCMYRFGLSGKSPELWHDNNEFPKAKIIEAWRRIASRYAECSHVFAYDLKNEPHGRATWGSGDPDTDWAQAVERMGNALHAVNPTPLIFAEGLDRRADGGCTFWGGDVEGLRKYVPKLQRPEKLVISPHVYGPDVALNRKTGETLDCFKDASFPRNMPAVWDQEWAFCVTERMAPLVVGEWGGRDEAGTQDRVWHEAFVDYMKWLGCNSAFYWAINANAGPDTKGLLKDDWRTVNMDKMRHIEELCPSPTKLDFGGGSVVVV